MSYTLDDCFRALDAVGSKPQWRKNGNEIRAVCPAHPATSDDGLQITLFNDGGLRPKCYSGCARDAVLEAIGLQKQSGTRPNPQRRPPKDDPPPEPRPLPSGAPWWKPWIYTDAEGTPVLAVVRKDLGRNLDTGKMKKTFLQFTPAPDAPGLWLPVGIELSRPLYRLPAILGAPADATIRVVEGEKCADTALAAWPSKIVTCWSGGANDQWKRTYWKPLAGRNVELLADGNEVGHAAMLGLAKHLNALRCRVTIALPDVAGGEDVADWLQQDDADAVEAKIQAMLRPYGAELHPGYERFLEITADWDNLPDDGEPPAALIERTDGKTLLYADKLNGVFGQPGGGKSWIGLQALVDTVAIGGRALWLDFEDRPATFRERARALGFEPRKQSAYHKWLPRTIMEDDEAQTFEAAVAWVSTYENGLVVIDAATQAGCPADGSEVDSWYRKHVDPWRQANVGVLVIDHVPKRTEDRPRGQIGSQGKLARVDGAALYVHGRAWTRDKPGSLKLVVHKDRPGYLPAATGETAAIVLGDPDDSGLLNIRFVPPNEAADGQPVADNLLAALAEQGGEAVGMRIYRELLGGKHSIADAAMKLLVEAGLVEKGKRGNATLYSVTADGYADLDLDAPHEQGDLM